MIYFVKPVGSAGPIKIGVSMSLAKRFACMRTDSPVELEIVATMDGWVGHERALHAMFMTDHSHGSWYHPSEKLLGFIAAVSAGEIPSLDIQDRPTRFHTVRSDATLRGWETRRREPANCAIRATNVEAAE